MEREFNFSYRYGATNQMNWGLRLLIALFISFYMVGAALGYDGLSFMPDQYERDDTPADASQIKLNTFAEQLRNFDKEDDQDWVWFHALESDMAIEIEVFNFGKNLNPVITLFDTDALTVIRESRQSWDPYGTGALNNTLSWHPTKDGIYYAKISNRDGSQFGLGAYYSLRVGRPIGPEMGYVYGAVLNEETGKFVGDALVTTIASSAISSNIDSAKGFYSLPCPAGTFTVTVKKTGFDTFKKNVVVGEAEGVELNAILKPAYAYHSSYELIQWGKRDSDGYYCLDICDAQNGVPFPGLQAIRCEDDFHAWSPKNYINIGLGVPDSVLSGFQFMWKVSSQSGYGGEGFEGIVSIP